MPPVAVPVPTSNLGTLEIEPRNVNRPVARHVFEESACSVQAILECGVVKVKFPDIDSNVDSRNPSNAMLLDKAEAGWPSPIIQPANGKSKSNPPPVRSRPAPFREKSDSPHGPSQPAPVSASNTWTCPDVIRTGSACATNGKHQTQQINSAMRCLTSASGFAASKLLATSGAPAPCAAAGCSSRRAPRASGPGPRSGSTLRQLQRINGVCSPSSGRRATDCARRTTPFKEFEAVRETGAGMIDRRLNVTG